jgi:hypothetical protein
MGRTRGEAPTPIGAPGEPLESDPVERALAHALTKAADAGEWAAVAKLAAELEARRKTLAEVVNLNTRRRRG